MTLSAFFRRTMADVNELWKTKKAPTSGAAWNELIRVMAARFGFRRLRTLSGTDSTGMWAIECDGTSVHLPIAGLAWEALRASAVSVVLRMPTGAPISVDSAVGQPVRAINGFDACDVFHGIIDNLASHVGASVRDIRTANELRLALAEPASLILLGCHGSNSGPLGDASLDLPDESLLVRDAFEGVSLPRPSTVLCITCFGGSGFLRSTGVWESMPSLLIAAGARSVAANRWHAWFEPATKTALEALAVALKAASTGPDAWPAAEALTRFMSTVHAANADARQWCGWSLFTRREYL